MVIGRVQGLTVRIVLVEPEIPQNTGSIARLAAATRTPLDLVGPLGFSLDDRYLRRAGLDYWPLVDLSVHDDWAAWIDDHPQGRVIVNSARRGRCYAEHEFARDDLLLFGSESKGLGVERIDALSAAGAEVLTIPIAEPGVRSLNLANAVSVILYEGLRQLGSLEVKS